MWIPAFAGMTMLLPFTRPETERSLPAATFPRGTGSTTPRTGRREALRHGSLAVSYVNPANTSFMPSTSFPRKRESMAFPVPNPVDPFGCTVYNLLAACEYSPQLQAARFNPCPTQNASGFPGEGPIRRMGLTRQQS